MKQLLRSAISYRMISSDRERGGLGQAALVVFPDAKYLRPLLKECAKAFFGAEDGGRLARLIDGESYSDCLFYPSEGGKLTVNDCAAIIDESVLLPVEGDKKLLVLDAFQTAGAAVQNKLLKVLEEPPAGVHFLIGTTSEYPVLSTVRSRVKLFSERPFPEESIRAALLRGGAGDAAREAAAACGGIYSVAENLVAGGGEEFRLAREFLMTDDRAKFCRDMNDYTQKKEFLSALTLLLRDMLLFSEGQERYAVLPAARELSVDYPSGALVAAIALVGEAEKQLQFNAGFGQCLFSLALQIEKERTKWQKLS